MQRVLSGLFGNSNALSPTTFLPVPCVLCRSLCNPRRHDACTQCGVHGFCSLDCRVAHLRQCTAGHTKRTPCRHLGPSWCVERALRGALRGFTLGFGVKATLSAVFTLLSSRAVGKAVAAALSLDNLRFGAFLSGLVGCNSGVRCLASHLRGTDDKWNAALAGAVGGMCIALDSPERQPYIGLYFLCRALYIASKAGMRQGWLPTIPAYDAALFGLCNCPIMYSFLLDSELLDKGYLKWIYNMGNLTFHSLQWSLRDPRTLEADGFVKSFRRCDLLYHPGEPSCFKAHTIDWFRGLQRGFKVYLPVHVVPALVFRLNSLKKEPAASAKKLASSVAASCAFITTYVYIVKMTMCVLRHKRHCDDSWHPALAGLLTGFSMFFEQPKRRSELTLYCIPHAVRALWRLQARHKLVVPPRFVQHHAGVFMMAAAAAIMLSLDRRFYSPTFQMLLRLLLGDAAGVHVNPASK